MKEKSLAKNYIYNLILTSINIVFPLVTSPYLSYVLGVYNIGKVNYATSIINWFILFASFGIPKYGIREIARKRDSKKEISNAFWNLIVIQVIFTGISLVFYILLLLNSLKLKEDINLYLVMLIMLILNIFSIDWFYQGIEEYEYITKRNIIVKIISLILIFLTVKNSDDYLIYASLNVFAMCFNNILNYINTKKYIKRKIEFDKIFFYIKELRIYFFTTLIISSYNQLDQVMVGSLSESALAYYSRSKMVLGVGINITNSIVTVFIPRVSYIIEQNYKKYTSLLQESLNYIYILALPCFAGIFMLSNELMVILGGNEFLPAAKSLKIISIVIVIASVGNWQVNQILISNRKERVAFIIQVIASIFSIALNLILIPKMSYLGAALTWVMTELLLVILEGIAIKYYCKKIRIRYINLSLVKYLLSLLIMILLVSIVKIKLKSNILVVINSVLLGGSSYFISLYILKEKITLKVFNKIIIKLKVIIRKKR